MNTRKLTTVFLSLTLALAVTLAGCAALALLSGAGSLQ
ncbi:hypothetical protein Dehly_1274 [Dehalogenimonas lykanthroporepellens BL-DC-9]|nr:hypothetical protein Dehly_1274 [Dehalogenimonas lykanthroporepellens BL-DC-9]